MNPKSIEFHTTKEERDKFFNTYQKSGNAAQAQIEKMITNLTVISLFFKFVDQNQIAAICREIHNKGYTVEDANVAFAKIRDTCKQFPSFSEILTLMPKRMTQKDPFEELYKKEMQLEEKDIKEAENQFNKVLGADKMESFCLWWVRECMGLSRAKVEDFGFNPMLFKRCALLDWKYASYTSDFNYLKKVVATKQKELDKIKKLNHLKTLRKQKIITRIENFMLADK